jgi:hypothetical protein
MSFFVSTAFAIAIDPFIFSLLLNSTYISLPPALLRGLARDHTDEAGERVGMGKPLRVC